MKISLIHPSRGRSKKAFDTASEWISKSGIDVEYVLSLDRSDNWKEYADLFMNMNFEFDIITKKILNENTCVVEATNHAAKESSGDILLYMSDDFKAPDNWGQLILKEFEGVTEPMLLKVDDCLQKFDVPVLTIPIMNRALYERLGYFFHPEYKSMFVDCHLHEIVKKNGWLKLAPHLKFPHEHVSIGKAENDETYRRSAANWEQGKAMFAKHKSQGFPL